MRVDVEQSHGGKGLAGQDQFGHSWILGYWRGDGQSPRLDRRLLMGAKNGARRQEQGANSYVPTSLTTQCAYGKAGCATSDVILGELHRKFVMRTPLPGSSGQQ